MAAKKGTTKSRKPVGSADVADFMASLEHPHKAVVSAVRKLILALDPRIREEVKWNAPSFCIAEHFATFRLQPAPICQLILHTGSKARAGAKRMEIPDQQGLLEWASAHRCVVSFSSSTDAKAKAAALKAILKSWIRQAGVA